MFDDFNIIVGPEIGTSKICVVIGEYAAGGALNIIGIGQAPTQGVRKGEFINPSEVEKDVCTTVSVTARSGSRGFWRTGDLPVILLARFYRLSITPP
jgi:cell division ATPase FtsA